jgi:hypothetical protein
MKKIIKQILTEESKFILTIINMLNKYFNKPLEYYSNFDDYDGSDYNVEIIYQLSDETRIWEIKDNVSQIKLTGFSNKKYEGTIYFDVLSLTISDNIEKENLHYYDDIPEMIWEELQDDLYTKLDSIIGSFVDYDISFNTKPLREKK